MSYPSYKINFGKIIQEYNRKQSKEWLEINQFCKRKKLEHTELIREAFERLSRKDRELLENPNTPEGLRALALLKRIMLELAKGMA